MGLGFLFVFWATSGVLWGLIDEDMPTFKGVMKFTFILISIFLSFCGFALLENNAQGLSFEIIDGEQTMVCDSLQKNHIGVYKCEKYDGKDLYFTKQDPAFGDAFREVG